MSRSRLATAALTAVAAGGLAVLPATAAQAETRYFYGYGTPPSQAREYALANMRAYSSSCVEIRTTYSPAGSAHTYKATLEANC